MEEEIRVFIYAGRILDLVSLLRLALPLPRTSRLFFLLGTRQIFHYYCQVDDDRTFLCQAGVLRVLCCLRVSLIMMASREGEKIITSILG